MEVFACTVYFSVNDVYTYNRYGYKYKCICITRNIHVYRHMGVHVYMCMFIECV